MNAADALSLEGKGALVAGGSVALLSSISGERGKPGQPDHAASKAGLTALGKTAAIELGHFGVRVNPSPRGGREARRTWPMPRPPSVRI